MRTIFAAAFVYTTSIHNKLVEVSAQLAEFIRCPSTCPMSCDQFQSKPKTHRRSHLRPCEIRFSSLFFATSLIGRCFYPKKGSYLGNARTRSVLDNTTNETTLLWPNLPRLIRARVHSSFMTWSSLPHTTKLRLSTSHRYSPACANFSQVCNRIYVFILLTLLTVTFQRVHNPSKNVSPGGRSFYTSYDWFFFIIKLSISFLALCPPWPPLLLVLHPFQSHRSLLAQLFSSHYFPFSSLSLFVSALSQGCPSSAVNVDPVHALQAHPKSID